MTLSVPRFTRWFVFALAAFTGAALIVPDVEAARRLGGGKSFGRQAAPPAQAPAQRDAINQAPQRPAQAAPGQPTGAPPAAAGNRWLGPIAGIAAGLGLAALLSHLGLGGALLEFLSSALLIGLLVMAAVFVWRMLRGGAKSQPMARRMEPAYGGGPAAATREEPAPAYASPAGGAARPGSVAATLAGTGSTQVVHTAPRAGQVPADFDADAFLRSAKVHFHRLQAAWDRHDLDDLSEFTTPEVFAELRMQLAEDSAAARNEVEGLDAELLGIDEGLNDWLASVRFRGSIREKGATATESFEEIWNLSKRRDGRTGWLLAGIQQVH